MEAKMAKMAKWRRHTVEFKRQVVERMKTCENIHALARELKIEPDVDGQPFDRQAAPSHAATHNRAVEKLLADLNPTQTVFPGPKPILVFKLGSA
jgi:hypothetical protein